MIEMWDIYDADKRRTGRTMQRMMVFERGRVSLNSAWSSGTSRRKVFDN